MAEKPAQAKDETVAGGKYLVGGVLVNALGEPVKEAPKEAPKGNPEKKDGE